MSFFCGFVFTPHALGQKVNQKQTNRSVKNMSELERKQAKEAEKLRVASSKSIRRFHEVLDDLLAEFGYDVKTGQLRGLQNLAIRKVQVSDALPFSYAKYVQMLVAERIRDNARVKLINCLPCETKTSRLQNGKMIITSPTTNASQLQYAANALGIDHFMDVILIYHTTHMVLAFQVFQVESKELVWSRTYNSETIRSRYQKLAIDYKQVAKSRVGEDYTPEYRILTGFGGAIIPNVGGDENSSVMLNLNVRSTERFNNRKHEFGMILSLYSSMDSIISEYPILEGTGTTEETSSTDTVDPDLTNPAQPQPFTAALNLNAIFTHNFIQSIESYNKLRSGIYAGGGVFMASGYFAATGILGLDLYFGRRFAVNLATIYLAPSKILLNNVYVETKGGVGGSVAISYNL